MKIVELMPTNGRKSFYGKARIQILDNGTIKLWSYSTIVCKLVNGKFIRTWDGYSVTSMTHINAFCDLFNLPHFDKSSWCALPAEKDSNTHAAGLLTNAESLQIMFARRANKGV